MVLEAGGLKKIHHFQFKASGEVLCRENVASEVTIFSLLKGPAALPDTLPTIIQPSGLSQQRREYLFQEIWEFVDQDYQDLVCPEHPLPNPPAKLQLHLHPKLLPSPQPAPLPLLPPLGPQDDQNNNKNNNNNNKEKKKKEKRRKKKKREKKEEAWLPRGSY